MHLTSKPYLTALIAVLLVCLSSACSDGRDRATASTPPAEPMPADANR